MGTVVLTLSDDDGVEHTFTLPRVVHMPLSPVNILSTRRLAEQFPSANGDPDKKGIGLMSTFDEHILFWNNRQHKKTCIASTTGLPELLFNSGFSIYQGYLTKVQVHYNDNIHWAFTSDQKSYC